MDSALERDSSERSESPDDANRPLKLKKELGLLEGVAIILGIIIGSGIFVSPKGVLERVESVGFTLLLWTLCGFLSMIGAVCYAELGTTIVRSGGDYAYASEIFGPFLSFLFLWDANVIFVPTTNAIMALTFGKYTLQPFFPGCSVNDTAVRLLAAAAICLLTFVNCYNVRLTTRLQNSFMVTKIAALVIVIITGVVVLASGRGQSFAGSFDKLPSDPSGVAIGFYSGIYSYAGWSYLNFMTEELKDPYKNLPRAIYISLPLVTVIYVLANVAYLAVLSPAEMIASEAIAVTFADKALGTFSWIMPVFVGFSALGALSVHIMTSSRLCFVGARDGRFPGFLSTINVKFFTPMPALVILCILSLLYLTSSDIFKLINYTTFVETSFIMLSILGLLVLRWKQPNRHRPIKVNLLFPITFLLICAFLVAVSVYSEPTNVGMALAVTLTGVPVYFIFIRGQKQLPRAIVSGIEKFNLISQKFFLTVKEG